MVSFSPNIDLYEHICGKFLPKHPLTSMSIFVVSFYPTTSLSLEWVPDNIKAADSVQDF